MAGWRPWFTRPLFAQLSPRECLCPVSAQVLHTRYALPCMRRTGTARRGAKGEVGLGHPVSRRWLRTPGLKSVQCAVRHVQMSEPSIGAKCVCRSWPTPPLVHEVSLLREGGGFTRDHQRDHREGGYGKPLHYSEVVGIPCFRQGAMSDARTAFSKNDRE